MKNSQKIFLVGFLFIFFSMAFTKKNRKPSVTLTCTQDTIYYNRQMLDSLHGSFRINFILKIRNDSNKAFSIHETDLIPGYEGDFDNYFLKIYKKTDGKMVNAQFRKSQHTSAEYPGVHINLPPGHEKTYEGSSGLYLMKEPGKYYIKAVFDGQLKFLGETNIDSVVVIDTSAGN